MIYKANFRLLGTFGLIAAAEGISKSRRARDTTLSVPLEANIHTECRIYRFSRIRSACVRTGQDRTPEANRWSSPAPAPGSESLRAVSMYLTQHQPQSSPQVTSEDIILACVRSLSARLSVNIRILWCENGHYWQRFRRSKLVTCVHDAQ